MDFKELHESLQQFPKTENELSEAVDQTALGKRLGLEHIGKGIYADAKGNKYTFNQQRQIFIGWTGTIKPSEADLKHAEEKVPEKPVEKETPKVSDNINNHLENGGLVTIRQEGVKMGYTYKKGQIAFSQNPEGGLIFKSNIPANLANFSSEQSSGKRTVELHGKDYKVIEKFVLAEPVEKENSKVVPKEVEEKPVSNDPFEPKNIEKMDYEKKVRSNYMNSVSDELKSVRFHLEVAGVPLMIAQDRNNVSLVHKDGTELLVRHGNNTLKTAVEYFTNKIKTLGTPEKFKERVEKLRAIQFEKEKKAEDAKKPVEKKDEESYESIVRRRGGGIPFDQASNRTRGIDSKDGVKVTYKTMGGETRSGFVDYKGGYLVDPKKRTEEDKHFADVKKKQLEMAKGVIQSEFDKLSDGEKVLAKKSLLGSGTRAKGETKLERAAYYMDANLSHTEFVEFVKTLGQDMKDIADHTMPPRLAKETFMVLNGKVHGMDGDFKVPAKVEGSFKIGNHTFHLIRSITIDHKTKKVKQRNGEYTVIVDGIGTTAGHINKKEFAKDFKHVKDVLNQAFESKTLDDKINNAKLRYEGYEKAGFKKLD